MVLLFSSINMITMFTVLDLIKFCFYVRNIITPYLLCEIVFEDVCDYDLMLYKMTSRLHSRRVELITQTQCIGNFSPDML